jgi:hypothetical protein
MEWTDEELLKLRRARDFYDQQIYLISLCENFGTRTLEALRKAVNRLDQEWEAPEGTKELPLRIETEPEKVLKEINEYIEGHANRRSKVPAYLLEPESESDPVEVSEIIFLEREVISLRDKLSAATRKLKLAHRQETLFISLAGVIKEEAHPLPYVEVDSSAWVSKREKTTSVDAVLLLSDEHGDSIVKSAGTWGLEEYDFNIFRCRMSKLVKTVADFATIHLPKHNFRKLWIFKLGDSVQGDIHGKADRNYFPNTLKAALAVGDVEAQAIAALAPCFPEGIHVVGVSGNHPRRSVKKDFDDPNNNFDYLVMSQIAARLDNYIKEGTVSVVAPESYTAYVEVRGKIWALNHGDDVKGYAGHPWYGFSRKNNRVQALVARKGLRIKYFTYGHYHTAIEMQEADAESLHAGAWYLTDAFAINKLAVGSEPVQPLFVVDEDHGRILSIPIYVRNEDAEERYRAGEWEPELGKHLTIDTLTGEEMGHKFHLIGGKE